MKKIILFTTLLLFPMIANAKTISINAYVDTNIKENISSIIVSLESETGDDGVVDYELLSSDNYKRVVNNFPDNEEIKFSYGTVVVGNVVDSIGKYSVELTRSQEDGGIYYISLKVTDPSIVTTTAAVKDNSEEENKKKEKLKQEKLLTYGIIAIVAVVLLIVIAIVGIKMIYASNLY